MIGFGFRVWSRAQCLRFWSGYLSIDWVTAGAGHSAAAQPGAAGAGCGRGSARLVPRGLGLLQTSAQGAGLRPSRARSAR